MDLALSTSTKCGSVALFENGQLIFEKKSLEQKSHSEVIHAFVDEGLRKNNADWASIKRVFLDKGPGSFTGIRVSLNLAKSLSFSLGTPIYAFDSLSLLAEQVRDHIAQSEKNPNLKIEFVNKKDLSVLTIINAFKNMVYFSCRTVDGLELDQLAQPTVLRVQELTQKIESDVIVVGDGYVAYENYLLKTVHKKMIRSEFYSDYPLAKTMGSLFYKMKNPPPSLDWKSVLPLYIRASEAEENKRGILFKPLE